MHNYNAPLKDMRFAMQELAELKDICKIPCFEAVDIETIDAVLAVSYTHLTLPTNREV